MSDYEKSHCAGEVRMEPGQEGEPAKIVGYAAKFNSRSQNLGGFVEVIAQGAFDEVLEDDVRGLFNHDRNFVLGRRAAGTLRLEVDEVGLRYEITVPDTQTIRDLVLAPIQRGDVTGSSFAFRVPSDGANWDEDEDGMVVRTITRFSRLLDVGPVTYPAYLDTEASARSLAGYQAHKAAVQARQDTERQQQHRDRYLATL